MTAFRVGYIVTLSFLLIIGVVTTTMGFFPPPKGQKAPEYPSYSSTTYDYNDTAAYQAQQMERSRQMTEYESQLKAYQDGQKNFIQQKIVPYARNVFVTWIIVVVIFEVMGLVLTRMGGTLVGGGFAFSGFWAVIFGPIGALLWYVNSLISSFSQQANKEFSSDPVLQAVAITSILGVVALTVVGFVMENMKKSVAAQPASQ